MEETQHDSARLPVGQPDLQRAAPAEAQLCGGHGALDQDLAPGGQIGDGGQAGAVLVARGEVEEQVLDRGNPQARQAFGQARADPLEPVHRDSVVAIGHVAPLWCSTPASPRGQSGSARPRGGFGNPDLGQALDHSLPVDLDLGAYG